jgi:hypothetical protein
MRSLSEDVASSVDDRQKEGLLSAKGLTTNASGDTQTDAHIRTAVCQKHEEEGMLLLEITTLAFSIII